MFVMLLIPKSAMAELMKGCEKKMLSVQEVKMSINRPECRQLLVLFKNN